MSYLKEVVLPGQYVVLIVRFVVGLESTHELNALAAPSFSCPYDEDTFPPVFFLPPFPVQTDSIKTLGEHLGVEFVGIVAVD